MLMGFVFFGVYANKWKAGKYIILLFPWICALGSEIIIFNASRYRALAIPFLIPIAVVGAVHIVSFLRQRQWKLILAAVFIFPALFNFGSKVLGEQHKQQYLSASLFNEAMMEAYGTGPTRKLALFSEERFLRRIKKSLEYDPDNLEAFQVFQKYLILNGQRVTVAENIKMLRMRCEADDWLCTQVCDDLEKILERLRAREKSKDKSL